MNNLKEIIEALKLIRTDTRTKVSDEILWDSAVRIFDSNKINKNNESKETEKATEKQIKLLKDLKIKFNENISKQEAKKIIESKLGKKKNGNFL